MPRKTITKLPAMPETDMQRGLLDLGKLYGYRTAHFRPGMMASGHYVTAVSGDGKGFPDTILLRAPRRLLVELKRTYADEVTKDQALWLDEGEACGFECYVVYACDLESLPALLEPRQPIQHAIHWRKTFGLRIATK